MEFVSKFVDPRQGHSALKPKQNCRVDADGPLKVTPISVASLKAWNRGRRQLACTEGYKQGNGAPEKRTQEDSIPIEEAKVPHTFIVLVGSLLFEIPVGCSRCAALAV